MIINMADDLNNNSSRRNNINNSQGSEDLSSADIEAALAALLRSSALATEEDDDNDLDQIAGEYSTLNNTIDELNKYLDRWDERHKQLREHIEEVKRVNEMEASQNEIDLPVTDKEDQASGKTSTSSSKGTDSGKDIDKPV